MGFPKALLPVGKRTLLEDQISRLKKAGCGPIIVVLGRLLRPKGLAMTRVVINRRWKLGQFSSLKCGLKALKNRSSGCLILPVDVPFVPVSVIKRILKTANKRVADAIIPFHRETGHPIWLSHALILKCLRMPAKQGRLDSIIADSERIYKLKTRSHAILNNINTPAEWKKMSR